MARKRAGVTRTRPRQLFVLQVSRYTSSGLQFPTRVTQPRSMGSPRQEARPARFSSTTRAIFVDGSAGLSTAISSVLERTILFETCNGMDDDCDGATDEGFPLFCDRPNGVTTSTICGDPGEHVCDGLDDNCNGATDEGLLNPCGHCGATPGEA